VLIAGALSSDPNRARSAAAEFGIATDRAYGSYRELLDAECQRAVDDRVDFISIATPNFTHAEIAIAALEAGFHVVCDKPMTTNLDELDDYGHAMIRFAPGALGLITWSQVTHGRLNDLSIEVDGTQAALTWRQEEPNQLFVRSLGQPTRIFERNPNADYCSADAAAACRLPGGHPEAFFEAFANLYRDAFADMRRLNSGSPANPEPIYPGVQDGHEGVRFMTRCLDSQRQQSRWQDW
jgi:predicted dehydrogenase